MAAAAPSELRWWELGRGVLCVEMAAAPHVMGYIMWGDRLIGVLCVKMSDIFQNGFSFDPREEPGPELFLEEPQPYQTGWSD